MDFSVTLPSEEEKLAIATILDDYIYILVDLYFGKFIKTEDIIDINDHMRVEYSQQIKRDEIVNGKRYFVSEFMVKAYHSDRLVLEFMCANRAFRILTIDTFFANMILNELDRFRKRRFENAWA